MIRLADIGLFFFLIETPISLINVFWYTEYFKSLGNHDKKVFWGWRKGWNKLIGGKKECHWFILMLSQTGHNKYFLLLVPQLFVEQNRTWGDGGTEAALALKQWHTDKKKLGTSSHLHFLHLFALTSFLVENQCFHDKPIRKSRNWICMLLTFPWGLHFIVPGVRLKQRSCGCLHPLPLFPLKDLGVFLGAAPGHISPRSAFCAPMADNTGFVSIQALIVGTVTPGVVECRRENRTCCSLRE